MSFGQSPHLLHCFYTEIEKVTHTHTKWSLQKIKSQNNGNKQENLVITHWFRKLKKKVCIRNKWHKEKIRLNLPCLRGRLLSWVYCWRHSWHCFSSTPRVSQPVELAEPTVELFPQTWRSGARQPQHWSVSSPRHKHNSATRCLNVQYSICGLNLTCMELDYRKFLGCLNGTIIYYLILH